MSETTYVHEIRPGVPLARVQLTMDVEEVMALGLVAGAAIDASVLAHETVDPETANNAVEILRWSAAAVNALNILAPAANGEE